MRALQLRLLTMAEGAAATAGATSRRPETVCGSELRAAGARELPGPGGCREHVVPGYSRCIGHVLEDARAPFARCAFTVGAHRCEMPVSTLRVAGALHGETLCLVHRRLAAMGAELAVDDGTPGTGREATRRGAGREGDPQGQRMAAQRRGRYASLAATLARTLGADDAYRKEYEAVLRQVGLVPRPKATPKELVGLLDMAGIVKAEEAGEGVASEGAGHDSSRAMRNLRRLGIVNEIFKGAYAELLRVPGPGGVDGAAGEEDDEWDDGVLATDMPEGWGAVEALLRSERIPGCCHPGCRNEAVPLLQHCFSHALSDVPSDEESNSVKGNRRPGRKEKVGKRSRKRSAPGTSHKKGEGGRKRGRKGAGSPSALTASPRKPPSLLSGPYYLREPDLRVRNIGMPVEVEGESGTWRPGIMVKVDASKRTLRVDYTDEQGGYSVPCVRFDRVRWSMDDGKEATSAQLQQPPGEARDDSVAVVAPTDPEAPPPQGPGSTVDNE